MADIADTRRINRAPIPSAVQVARIEASPRLKPLIEADARYWHALATQAIEPNGYYLPDWELAVNAFARGRGGASALAAWSECSSAPARLIGLVPVISSWQAYKIPLPALVTADPYGTLCTPMLDRALAVEAAAEMMRAARRAGARALILRDVVLDGDAMKSFEEAARQGRIQPHLLQSHTRAYLDATRDAEQLLREALGGKKFKELRRQRNRLAEHGELSFTVARQPEDIARALEIFLTLEASGWKAKRGTALVQHDGDAAFIRRAALALAEKSQCEIATLSAGATAVAAGVVLRHQDRAFFFKLGVDERFAKYSPGVQLTLDLTHHLCADPAIKMADSTACSDHPMINPIWRGRLPIGDVLIPLRANDPVTALIRAAMASRKLIREPLRRVAHFVLNRQEKSS